MKYLILSNGPALLNGADESLLKHTQDTLQKGLDSGKVEAAYALVSGGVCMVVNAPGNAELARALRTYHLGAKHDVQVIPLVDAIGTVKAHLEHRASLKMKKG
ncbi:MAG TPA: hypothetical protein PKE06_07865 [Flavilitoribacter sp.]|nr:hypothetical protein [Flavilitoribacter sp.]HMQ87372.1 hypothetical protein [Flavilitoribacter sp.]